MTKAANSLNSNKVAWQGTRMTQRVEGGDSGTHERRSFSGIKRFRHAGKCLHRRNHEFLVAAVITHSANQSVHAVDEIPSPALETRAILPAMPADTNTFARLPTGYTGAELIDHSSYFMSRHSGIRNAGKDSLLGNEIAVTDSARLNANPDLSRAGLRNLTLHNLKIRPRLRYLHCFHFCHLLPPHHLRLMSLGGRDRQKYLKTRVSWM